MVQKDARTLVLLGTKMTSTQISHFPGATPLPFRAFSSQGVDEGGGKHDALWEIRGSLANQRNCRLKEGKLLKAHARNGRGPRTIIFAREGGQGQKTQETLETHDWMITQPLTPSCKENKRRQPGAHALLLHDGVWSQ